jgi:hypothetical protein
MYDNYKGTKRESYTDRCVNIACIYIILCSILSINVSTHKPVCRDYTEHEQTTLLDISRNVSLWCQDKNWILITFPELEKRKTLLFKIFLMFLIFQR